LKYIRINKLQWAGLVTQMNNECTAKRILLARPEGKRGILKTKDEMGRWCESRQSKNRRKELQETH